ncbi:hypothetical protein [Evansella tamaricis]|uniref:DPH-type MB domain-containing protein n=1 Tax=Evansella tamaricis TaxID=2069301 RepID=A0ABS6JG69_9BACI|nr:hypothetical protein [Evansella tamaricis]MBU9711373.1 hypothetical protein [Evansella tamaricis]MBU9712395.1 hypothetical protein [Evansella tamaricis]MBU9712500.1 hypothetical protein [Evansella tamaricis]MBU9714593.1 hypothetical protein [Evansella tamaricis]MBU9714607.1 hypothetical protein [Evansella tamaricis]
MSSKKEQDNTINDPFLRWLEEGEDPFGLHEDQEDDVIIFKCLDCKKTDEVPDFVVGDFSVDLKEGEKVEIECPYCSGTMHEASDVPSK